MCEALSVLKTVELGHASDPPGVQLYFKTGRKDKFGLTLYRCVRGTNSLEGGVHQNLIRKFGSFGAGPELADAMLTEYRLRHNIDVGTVNRRGHSHKGHYNPWLVQHIDLMCSKLGLQRANNHISINTNALSYRGSEEIFGICPLPEDKMVKLGVEKADQRVIEPNNLEEDDLTIPKLQETVHLKAGSTQRPKNSRYIHVAKSQQQKNCCNCRSYFRRNLFVHSTLQRSFCFCYSS